jgi:hypothetical protein
VVQGGGQRQASKRLNPLVESSSNDDLVEPSSNDNLVKFSSYLESAIPSSEPCVVLNKLDFFDQRNNSCEV